MTGRPVRMVAAAAFAVVVVATGLRVALYVASRARGYGAFEAVLPTKPLAVTRFSVGTLAALAAASMGLLLATRRPRNLIGWSFLAGALLLSVSGAAHYLGLLAILEPDGVSLLGVDVGLPGAREGPWLARWMGVLGLSLIGVVLLLLFPDGRLPRRAVGRALVAAGFVVVGLHAAQIAFGDYGNPVPFGPNPHPVGWLHDLLGWQLEAFERTLPFSDLLYVATLMGAGLSLVFRFVRSRGERRQQMKWFAAAGSLAALALVGLVALYFSQAHFEPRILGEEASEVFSVLFNFSMALVAVAAAIAIFRYRLYDIDVVLNRAILFGCLAVFVTGGYVLLAVVVGQRLAGGQPGVIAPVGAMAAVALAFEPVRNRTERLANRLVYGERATPYEALSRFTRRLAEVAFDEMLPRLAEEAGHGLGAARIEARVFLATGGQRAATWPAAGPAESVGPAAGDGAHRHVTVGHDGVPVGAIDAWKRRGDPFTTVEEQLLRSLADHAGLAFRNVALTVELEVRLAELETATAALRRSQRRLVTAQLAARAQLERELRTRVEPALSRLEAVATPERVDEAEAAADAALDHLRAIVRGIFPPLLNERGLVETLESQARRRDVDVSVEATPAARSRRFDPNVEAVAYFCCAALARRSRGRVAIRLDADERDLRFDVHWPDGRTDPRTEIGDELQDLADHLEALGGSLEIRYVPGRPPTLHGVAPSRPPGGGPAAGAPVSVESAPAGR